MPFLHKTSKCHLPLIFCVFGLWICDSQAAYNPRERIDYWRNNYHALSPQQDARVTKAQQIFQRLKQAAGVGIDDNPHLHVVLEDPYNISLPISIRDGWVILSKRVLDICYSDSASGDDKLAFVLGHELGHLLYDSFMHVQLFNALDTLKQEKLAQHDSLERLKELVSKPEHFAYKEFEADEKGILFATMAGFNTSVIVNAKGEDSFFNQWQRAQKLERFFSSNSADTHPVVRLREQRILEQLKTVEQRAQLFVLGLLYYESGNFQQAIHYFENFAQFFPSREVYHNLATAYHQLGIKQYLAEVGGDAELPFQFNLIADPESRAVSYSTRRYGGKTVSYSSSLKKAIRYYKKAIELDANYLISYSNLGAAYLSLDDPYKAIALLEDAREKWPKDSKILNTLGVAFHSIDKPDKALELLNAAKLSGQSNPAVLYNLGKIFHLQGKDDKATSYWKEYLKQDDVSYWARLIRNKYGVGEPLPEQRGLPKIEFESVNGVQIADYLQDIPNSWQTINEYVLQDTKHRFIQFNNGVETVLNGDSVKLIRVGAGFKGKTTRGISIGVDKNPVLKAYGQPALRVPTLQGNNWVYPDKGVSFQFRDGRVVSWLVY